MLLPLYPKQLLPLDEVALANWTDYSIGPLGAGASAAWVDGHLQVVTYLDNMVAYFDGDSNTPVLVVRLLRWWV